MYRETGDPESAIWLLGDSNPKSENAEPDAVDPEYPLNPLDSRHPTRHNIWTPVLDVVQRHLFVARRSRLDDSGLYVRNAVGNPAHRREKEQRSREIAELRNLLDRYRPPLLVPFAAFAYEFARHSLPGIDGVPQSWTVWNVKLLAGQFDEAISCLTGPDAGGRLESTTVLPLLHAIGARQFRYCHREFSHGSGNYFEYVGGRIAAVLIG
ncbi:MAG: hypothetical protein ABI806_02015 [Candidatus Solibacter sp.]